MTRCRQIVAENKSKQSKTLEEARREERNRLALEKAQARVQNQKIKDEERKAALYRPTKSPIGDALARLAKSYGQPIPVRKRMIVRPMKSEYAIFNQRVRF